VQWGSCVGGEREEAEGEGERFRRKTKPVLGESMQKNWTGSVSWVSKISKRKDSKSARSIGGGEGSKGPPKAGSPWATLARPNREKERNIWVCEVFGEGGKSIQKEAKPPPPRAAVIMEKGQTEDAKRRVFSQKAPAGGGRDPGGGETKKESRCDVRREVIGKGEPRRNSFQKKESRN